MLDPIRPRRDSRARRRGKTDDGFQVVRAIGRRWADVAEETRYDGAPVLRIHGCFMAALASHSSAEPDSLVVRVDLGNRERFLADAPDVYYVTDYYERHPVVLVRLPLVTPEVIEELLAISRRLTLLKCGTRSRARRRVDL